MHSKLRHGLGPLLWALCCQYFFAEIIAAHAFRGEYSLADNYISDLGAVLCTPALCSPLHAFMNASFVLQGFLIFAGSVFLRRNFRHSYGTEAGLLLLAVSGVGLVCVGLAPEDINPALHYSGATAHFLSGGVGMVVLGLSLLGRARTAKLGRITLAAGTTTLVASVLLGKHHYLGLGVGGMERFAAYPYTAWLTGIGVGMLSAGRPA
jgi:hypothetical membrane protein